MNDIRIYFLFTYVHFLYSYIYQHFEGWVLGLHPKNMLFFWHPENIIRSAPPGKMQVYDVIKLYIIYIYIVM